MNLIFLTLESLRSAYFTEVKDKTSPGIDNLIWLALTCILRECSHAGTAQWQYVLPNKTKSRVNNPLKAFGERIDMFKSDIYYAQTTFNGSSKVINGDARNPKLNSLFDLVVTSPPYPNNYDYADSTRLEMTFWGDVNSWGDLQSAVRRHLVRSCSQHAAAERLSLPILLEDTAVLPIRDELESVCSKLSQIRQTKAGKKTYHTMVAAYFCDLSRVWRSLRQITKPRGKVAFVIGDSAPYGIYVPSDRWLGELALAAGFRDYRFEKLRDRNIKWKNRKHRVPLKEGILWVES